MENQKLTAEEIADIQSIQEKTRAALLELGELEIHANSIVKRKENVFATLTAIRTQEQELAQSLTERYGDGSIDLNTGEFTPKTEDSTEE